MSVIPLVLNVKTQVSISEILEQIEILHDDEKMELIEIIFEKIRSISVQRELLENLGDKFHYRFVRKYNE